MKTKRYIAITFEGKTYNIDADNLISLLEKLSGENITYENDEQIFKYMKKYKLYDEIFLENINNI